MQKSLPVKKMIILSLGIMLGNFFTKAQTTCGDFYKIGSSSLASGTLGIKTGGTLWGWGYNQFGQLGDGTTLDKTSPVRIGSNDDWAAVSAGDLYTIALKNNGTLWAWGENDEGGLGDGTFISKSTPVQVGAANNWMKIASTYHSLAIRTDGTLWTWGYNNDGQLGDGGSTNRNSPVQIGIATNWSSVSAGAYHSAAIRTDGTLWTWGYNALGSLGNGTTTNRNTPTRVGTASDWASVSCGIYHTLALKTDGSLWAWGRNVNGEIGDGTTTMRTVPTRIGTANDWVSISAGGYHSGAVKSDGTLWLWGDNKDGAVGDGTTTERHQPLQVGAARQWVTLNCGRYHSSAIASDGTLWAWGNNANGRIGDATTVNKLSPVQITSNNLIILGNNNSSRLLHVTTSTTFFNEANCNLIATVLPGGALPITGNTTAKVWVEGSQHVEFVKRHHEILPATNAATATGMITLYYTQAEFNDFNAVNTIKLPSGPADNTGKANLLIEKRPGTSGDGSGLPGTYTGTPVNIDPVDTDIVWNAATSRWEVSFNTTGFSGFFVKTTSAILPLHWLSVKAVLINGKAKLSWQVDEQRVSYYEVEKSSDGSHFHTIAHLPGKGHGINSYGYMDMSDQNAVVYYRVRQTDLDGTFTYSSVIRLSKKNSLTVSVYPTLFTDGFTVVSNTTQTAQLLSFSGQLLKILPLKAGSNYIPAGHFSSGLYLLKTGDGKLKKLVKQ